MNPTLTTPSEVSKIADNAAKQLGKLPVGCLPSERAFIVQSAIDAETSSLSLKAADRDEWQQVATKLREETDNALRYIREATDGALDASPLAESVAILISQRDNARNEAAHYRGDSLKLNTLTPKLTDCENALALMTANAERERLCKEATAERADRLLETANERRIALTALETEAKELRAALAAINSVYNVPDSGTYGPEQPLWDKATELLYRYRSLTLPAWRNENPIARESPPHENHI